MTICSLLSGEERVSRRLTDTSSVSDGADRVGIKTGIHFGDGRSVVEEFRATVVR
jgi:hypothetical protein